MLRRWTGFALIMLLAMGSWSPAVAAGTLEVRLEPFPPLILEDGSGLMVKQLREVAERAGWSMNIEIVSYSRAKYQLRNGQADLIGLIPVGRETQEFYGYAEELDWRLDTRADLFAVRPDLLDGDAWKDEPVGTPWGNADFFAPLTGVPRDRFVESSLANLVQMLTHDRLPVLLFERASTLAEIERLDGGPVYYRNLFHIPAGFAVQKNESGRRLKRRLDELLPSQQASPWLRSWHRYLSLPDRGRLPGTPLTDCADGGVAREERESAADDC